MSAARQRLKAINIGITWISTCSLLAILGLSGTVTGTELVIIVIVGLVICMVATLAILE